MKVHWKQAVPVLILGMILGAAMGSWAHRMMFRRFMKDGPRPERMVEKLGRELKLDPAQKESLRKVLEAKHAQMEAFHKDTAARFEELRASFESDIKKLLTPEQQARFDALSSRWKARHPAPGGSPKELR